MNLAVHLLHDSNLCIAKQTNTAYHTVVTQQWIIHQLSTIMTKIVMALMWRCFCRKNPVMRRFS